MPSQRLHSWKVSPAEAILIQQRLRERIVFQKGLPCLTKIAAADVSFLTHRNYARAAVVVFSFPQFELLEKVIKTGPVNFPYIPGLLTFREGPILLKAFSGLKNQPDLVLFDGQGIAHPRNMGLATHMGIWLNLPTIGCAKTSLYGQFQQPPPIKGAYKYIYDTRGKIIGAVLRTRKDVRCLFISVGYKIDLQSALKVVLACAPKWRIPEPLRVAHQLSR